MLLQTLYSGRKKLAVFANCIFVFNIFNATYRKFRKFRVVGCIGKVTMQKVECAPLYICTDRYAQF